ncbi:MAG: hypothetical protein PGN33_26265 [Methylobacterium radiotolerans]
MSNAARKSAANGLWLCQNCGKLIDSDETQFSVELLRGWKKQAEARAALEVATGTIRTSPRTLDTIGFDGADQAFVASLGLPPGDAVPNVAARMQRAASTDLAAFRATKEWPIHTVELGLTLRSDTAKAITMTGLAAATQIAGGINLVSPPGTGKTTTLIQLAETILAAGDVVPVFVPLGEWSDRHEDFFSFLARRNAFRAFTPQHFMLLAAQNRLCLLLDGWNELSPEASLRATRDLDALRRDFPLLGWVIGTRKQQLLLPGSVVEIQRLSDGQQEKLGRELGGAAGVVLVDQAWRTPGIRELISIPLYFTSLVSSTPTGVFPQTKEEVLRNFVFQHEQMPVKALGLKNVVGDFHRDYLTALAVCAQQAATTQIGLSDARRAITQVAVSLQGDGQIAAGPDPSKVLDVLVDAHLLVRAADEGGVSFQHQQFQEWFASFEVERLMLLASGSDAAASAALRQGVLNWPAWEEAILFACERVSRGAGLGAEAVVRAVREALAIDPMLAAAMIHRSAPQVWALVRTAAMGLVERWHRPGRVDRAVRFMIISGRPEFASYIWPLIESDDRNIYYRALDAAPRFRPSVLGADAKKRLKALPTEARGEVLAEIARGSGFDGMELATAIAQQETDPAIVVKIVQALEFRLGHRHITAIMSSAAEAVWMEVARENYPDEFADPVLNERLSVLRHAHEDSELDSAQQVARLIRRAGTTPDTAARIEAIMMDLDFTAANDRANEVLHEAHAACPGAVATALKRRLLAGLPLPYKAEDYLIDAPTSDEPELAALARQGRSGRYRNLVASSVVGSATIKSMMEEFFAVSEVFRRKNRPITDTDRSRFTNLQDGIVGSRDAAFYPALFALADTHDPAQIELMAGLLSRRQQEYPGKRIEVADALRTKLTATVTMWIDRMLSTQDSTRHQRDDVARAAGCVGSPSLAAGVAKMLERDLAEWKAARETWQRHPGGGISPDVSHSYTLTYCDALASIGSAEAIEVLSAHLRDPRIAVDAACALAAIWSRANPSGSDRRFGMWTDFSEAAANRALRVAGTNLPSCDAAQRIMTAAAALGTADQSDEQQRLSLALATVALGVPHGALAGQVVPLLSLPQTYDSKLGVLRALALSGEILSAETLVTAFDEALADVTRESWRLQNEGDYLLRWIELFPFADDPSAVLTLLNRLPPSLREHWHLRRLLYALGESPHPDAVIVLMRLGERHGMPKEQDWWQAFFKIGTEAAGLALVQHIAGQQFSDQTQRIDSWYLEREFARLAAKHPSIRAAILECYAKIEPLAKRFLTSVLAQKPDKALILWMLCNRDETGSTDALILGAVEALAVGERPATDWAGAFERFSAPTAALRRDLFAMSQRADSFAPLAVRCLERIDRCRDEHGLVDDEPRHPDLASGFPWPPVTAEPILTHS